MSALTILAEECELLNDSKYRNYITQVEKALKSFEYTSEWADLISALGKLNKALLSHAKYPVIPKRVTIGKRLAQCLHPALPSGVHLKALETYDIIFRSIGTYRLAQDLFIYTAGLFPLLGHAAMSVKPALLAVYENHFLPLEKQIKPALNGLILGLLPGLEEGSEFFDRTNRLLDSFCDATDSVYFYTCLWESIHSCPAVRLPAISFLLLHFNKRQSMEDQIYMMGLNIDLMVESMCSAVNDENILVQRCMLDFLLAAFPMHNGQLTKADIRKIVKAAVDVVLRRDMSLNRRLYAWLLGMDTSGSVIGGTSRHPTGDSHRPVSTEIDLTYFHTYSKDFLIHAVKFKLSQSAKAEKEKTNDMKSSLKPFRILISLLDKPEIGATILENVLLSVFQCLHTECEKIKSSTTQSGGRSHRKREVDSYKDSKMYNELVKTANLLFGTFEPYFIWEFCGRMFELSCKNTQSGRTTSQSSQKVSNKQDKEKLNRQTSESLETEVPCLSYLCSLINFLLDVVSLDTLMETQTEHLPELLRCTTNSLINYHHQISDFEITCALQLCTKLLAKVQPSMTAVSTENSPQRPDNDNALNEMNNMKEVEVEVEVEQDNTSCESIPTEVENGLDNSDGIRGEKSTRVIPGTTTDSHTPKLVSQKTLDQSPTSHSSDHHPEEGHNVPMSLMQKCIHCFQNFFHIYVTERIFVGSDLATRCIEAISLPIETVHCGERDMPNKSRKQLCKQDINQVLQKLRLAADHLKPQRLKAFKCACQLLVDFASFPVYFMDCDLLNKRAEGPALPVWFEDLLTCTSFVDSFAVCSSAISTMLDLILLAQSVQSSMEHQQASPGQPKSMAILPALMPHHLRYLNGHLQFYKLVATVLWNYLSQSESVCHQRSVELFHFLHQVTPNSWVCEDVIGQALTADRQEKRIEAYKKFTVLWHLTRDKRTDVNPGLPLRTFDRSMFVVVDSLKDEMSPMKTLATTWLTHVVQRGDINRVLEPILLMLLHPDTARVSIQHINMIQQVSTVQQADDGREECPESRICGISSEGGNVVYHVGTGGKSISPRSDEEQKSVTLQVSHEKGSMKTEHVKRHEHELHFERVNPEDLKLRINPFGSQSSLDKLIFDGYDFPFVSPPAYLEKVRRLDKDICVKEGIYFDEEEKQSEMRTLKDEEHEDSGDSEVCSGEIVTGIVEEIVDTAVSHSTGDHSEKHKSAQRPQNLGPITPSTVYEQDSPGTFYKQAVGIDSPTVSEVDIGRPIRMDSFSADIHSLHMHVLLYTQKYDCQRTLYSLSTLQAMLSACPRLIVTAMVTTSISSFRTPQLAKLQSMLARHRKSVFGKNFFGELPPDSISGYRSSMFIEIIISVALYFIRSYYPDFMLSEMSPEELHGNKEVHIVSTEVLTLLMSELVTLIKQSGKNFMSYIKDLLIRCKMQKAILHCAAASVHNVRCQNEEEKANKMAESVICFKEESLDNSLNETFQIKLLNLLLVLIMLEHECQKVQSLADLNNAKENTETFERPRLSLQSSLLNIHFNSNLPIIQQSMFVSCVITALKQFHMCHMHRHWISLVISALPYMGTALSNIVGCVVVQLCKNLEAIAAEYETDGRKNTAILEEKPPDHTVTMLEALTTICHYCLLDNLSQVPQRDMSLNSPVMEARRLLLSILPRIISCMAVLWKSIQVAEQGSDSQADHPSWTVGSPKVVKFYILEFLSPVSFAHGVHLLGALAVAWNDRRKKSAPLMKKVIPVPCEDQLLLVDLVNAIRILPIDTLIQTIKQVIKQPPPSDLGRGKRSVSLEVNMLQFFYAYVQQASSSQLADSWISLLSLLKEVLQLNLSPPGQFLLLEVLNEFVQRIPAMDDKRNQKELQDISQKLLEVVSAIGGSALEQTTWLRRNLAVKPGLQRDVTGSISMAEEKKVMEPELNTSVESKYNVQALTLLAEVTAPLLDVVYSSDEKDKAVPFLSSLLNNVFPYLRNHSHHNLPSFRACSKILSSISGYQYTRKSWRKEAFELFFDSSFFQMDVKCIRNWHSVVDNLMTYDKTTFKELMTRVTMTQSGSLNLFSSKEQEFEQRAQMLKRLAFTIFCSEPDQYQKSVPEIQERLSESLRLPHVPSVIAQVFLCFRVLLLRISPQHLTSMWPTIITEMVCIFFVGFVYINCYMLEIIQTFCLPRVAALDSSWAYLGNGLNAHNNPAWLQLYLSVCKLLDLALALPADTVPQFQLYRWAFIGGVAAGDEEAEKIKKNKLLKPKFIPHVIRLAKLINSKLHSKSAVLKQVPGRPLLTFTTLRSLSELQPFFNTLCCANQSGDVPDQVGRGQAKLSEPGWRAMPKSKSTPAIDNLYYGDIDWQTWQHDITDTEYIEELLWRDFLEPLPE
ncbi:hypothetical protein ScPMuIL_012184 [Solemya velum]